MPEQLKVGQWARPDQSLGNIISKTQLSLVGYVSSQDVSRLQLQAHGIFYPNNILNHAYPVSLTEIEDHAVDRINEESLASTYGGPVPTKLLDDKLRPVLASHRLKLSAISEGNNIQATLCGVVVVDAAPQSFAGHAFERVWSLGLREIQQF
jgi:putative peptide zinc metalloprotease protein